MGFDITKGFTGSVNSYIITFNCGFILHLFFKIIIDKYRQRREIQQHNREII